MSRSKKSSRQDYAPSSSYHLNFDEYHEPVSMPAHWDLSELPASMRDHLELPDGQASPSHQAPEMLAGEGDGVGGMSSDWQRNAFPMPRTFPAKWDLPG